MSWCDSTGCGSLMTIWPHTEQVQNRAGFGMLRILELLSRAATPRGEFNPPLKLLTTLRSTLVVARPQLPSPFFSMVSGTYFAPHRLGGKTLRLLFSNAAAVHKPSMPCSRHVALHQE